MSETASGSFSPARKCSRQFRCVSEQFRAASGPPRRFQAASGEARDCLEGVWKRPPKRTEAPRHGSKLPETASSSCGRGQSILKPRWT
eukprot:2053348-Alexandrium_andersonii.AAC.1